MPQALRTIEGWIHNRQQNYICVTGVHGVMECQQDESLRKIHNRAGLVTPDGMPLVWLARRAGFRQVARVYGPDLMLALCRESVESGYRHYFYGGGPKVAETLQARLQGMFSGFNVVGTHTPPYRELREFEDNRVVDLINACSPDVVWIGLSTPKQERWMAANLGRINAPVMIGVGAAFDFHAGLKKQAPPWMQRSGLEWLFRFVSEPRRLGPRYLSNNPRFILALLKQEFSR